MPELAHSGLTGNPWHRCDRCGVEFRVSQLRWQNGLLICQDDYDDPLAWERAQIITDVLTDSPNEMQVAEVLKGEGNEPEFNY